MKTKNNKLTELFEAPSLFDAVGGGGIPLQFSAMCCNTLLQERERKTLVKIQTKISESSFYFIYLHLAIIFI